MRNRLALSLVVALSVAAGSQERPAARVQSLTGSAEVVQGMKGIHPTKATERIAPGSSLNLAGSGKVRLSFYGDGHVEEVSGPCLVRVEASGCRVVHGGSGCLARLDGKKRILVLSQGGNLQSVGGSVAGISDPSTSRVSSRSLAEPPHPAPPRASQQAVVHPAPGGPPPPPPPPPPAVASAKQSASPGLTLRGLPNPEPLDFFYHQSQGIVTLEASTQSLEEITADLVQGGNKQPLTFKGNRLVIAGKPGDVVVVEISRNGSLEQKLPLRILNRREEAEVTRLLADKLPFHAAIVIDRLEQIGLPFLAASRAESLLLELKDQDAGLLTYLYHLYTHDLDDRVKADRVRQRAINMGLTLP